MHKIIAMSLIIVSIIITVAILNSRKTDTFWEKYKETERLLDSVKTLREQREKAINEFRESPIDTLASSLLLPTHSGNTY